MLRAYLVVMAGGALGSALRFWLAEALTAKTAGAFPTGTLVVNVSGCFLIGLIAALTAAGGLLEAPLLVRQFLMVGFLGGFTTFSAFSLQTMHLAQSGHWPKAALNVVLSILLCLLAAAAGHLAAAFINRR